MTYLKSLGSVLITIFWGLFTVGGVVGVIALAAYLGSWAVILLIIIIILFLAYETKE